jgi:hypothetical protein
MEAFFYWRARQISNLRHPDSHSDIALTIDGKIDGCISRCHSEIDLLSGKKR